MTVSILLCDDAFFTNIGLHQRILGSVRFGVGRTPLVVVAVDECQVSGTGTGSLVLVLVPVMIPVLVMVLVRVLV